MSRILLTGAGGDLGKVLRASLAGVYQTIRLSDIAPMDPAGPGEEVVPCDLADAGAVADLVEGCDAIVHLGGMSVENTFEVILNANIRGTYNIYEAARRHGVGRVLFASSNHVTGFYGRETRLDASSEMRPDSLYGVSKGFGELLARYYFEKFGMETAAVRIGSCVDAPRDQRMLATWMSFRDFTDLVRHVLDAEYVGYSVIYGASNNSRTWWDNRLTAYLGWQPVDSADDYAADLALRDEGASPNDPAVRFQGGAFAAAGHFEDGGG